jgi:sulfite exporter TauE/SafE
LGASLSLAGVMTGAIGGFVVATTYDHRNPIERKLGIAIGIFLMVVGTGLFIAGWRI